MDLAKGIEMPELPKRDTSKMEEIAERKRGSIEGRERDNLNMALMQAGFAMMAGTSPYAFENMGKGAMAGLQAYAEGKKDIRDLEKEIDEVELKIEEARSAGDMDKYNALMAERQMLINLGVKSAEIASRENIAGMGAARADKSETRAGMVAMTTLSGQLQRLIKDRSQAMDPADRADYDAQIAQVRSQMRMYAQEFGLPYAETEAGGSSLSEQAQAELDRRRAAAAR